MTKEEKIEKVEEILGNCRCRTYDMIANQIVVALEEPEERFLQNEIVYSPGIGYGHFGFLGGEIKHKVSAEELAATVGARIPGAKWAAVDCDNIMHWFKDEPKQHYDGMYIGDPCCRSNHSPYVIYCPVKDWTKAKWRLK